MMAFMQHPSIDFNFYLKEIQEFDPSEQNLEIHNQHVRGSQ